MFVYHSYHSDVGLTSFDLYPSDIACVLFRIDQYTVLDTIHMIVSQFMKNDLF